MSFRRKNRQVEEEESGDDNPRQLFVQDGRPVRFFMHRSITNGRDRLKDDITRNGGIVQETDKAANVVLVDDQKIDQPTLQLTYSCSELEWKRFIYVERLGFVSRCIRTGNYSHPKPKAQGMPGPTPYEARVAYTPADDANLARYIAYRIPNAEAGGRTGNNLYMELEMMGAEGSKEYRWAKNHTWQSWRNRYKTKRHILDPMIQEYVDGPQGRGLGLARDPRSRQHNRIYPMPRRPQVENAYDDNDDVPNQQHEQHDDIRAQEIYEDIAGNEDEAPAKARDKEVEEEFRVSSPDSLFSEVEEPDNGKQVQKRRRNGSDAHSSYESPQKRRRVAIVSEKQGRQNDPQPQRPDSPPRPPSTDEPDLFLTQRTLVNSPDVRRLSPPRAGPSRAAASRTRDTVVPVRPLRPRVLSQAHPPLEDRLKSPRSRVGQNDDIPATTKSSEAAKKSSKDIRISKTPSTDAPYRNTRARSKSVDPEPVVIPQPKSQKGKEKAVQEPLEAVPESDLDEELQVEQHENDARAPSSFRLQVTPDRNSEELVVEDILGDMSISAGGDLVSRDMVEQADQDSEDMDSDDAQIHRELNNTDSDDEDSDDDGVSGLELLSNGGLVIAERNLRDIQQVRRRQPDVIDLTFSSPDTKGRQHVVQQIYNATHGPYKPPPGSRADKAKGKLR
ncbi:hypothetical protein BJ138DRAFT_1126305 [Hygrophoropsis aurantiaca]|uniref:Uncharacterized protein n=1 Tax=Hygrophoropsis aurantiaca TaxID=72124 RepID=A0ACB8ACU3_9AGAM|nr:hypothetical protein BJ138DRAFT_1126305 [Hygrophoropsis aurantiaca]